MKRVRDPIHNHIRLDEPELALVNQAAFQRLRGLRQLGLAYLVYPGANHTRFEHSLGTCHLSRELARASDLEPAEVTLAGLAGLLHDLGHGPYSHLSDAVEGLPPHEEVTVRRVREGPVAETLERLGRDPAEVARVLSGEHPLSPLISSEIDADRMDYLVRDAYYCGVSTGADLGRLVATLKLKEGRLQVAPKALAAVEALLVARHIMYPIVYFHATARGAELMMARGVEALLREGRLGAEEFFALEEGQLLARMEQAPGVPAEAVADLRRRQLPRALLELGRDELDGDLLDRLARPAFRREVELELAGRVELEPHQVLLDVPPPQHPEATFKLCVLRPREGSCQSLEQASTLADSLYQAQFDHWRLRLYGPRELSGERRGRLIQAARGRLAA